MFVAPLLSPITVALTWSLLGWRMTVARVIAALLGSSLLGAVINRYEAWFEATRRPMIAGASPELDLCYETHAYEQNGAPAAPGSVWQQLAVNLRHITCRVVPYFIAGIALAAAVSTLLPDDAIPRALGGAGGVSAYLLAAVAGAPLYVCQGEEVPLTYAVLASGVSPGPALTFLLGAVGMCLPTVVMSRGVLAPRVTYFYVAFWIAFVILAGVTSRPSAAEPTSRDAPRSPRPWTPTSGRSVRDGCPVHLAAAAAPATAPAREAPRKRSPASRSASGHHWCASAAAESIRPHAAASLSLTDRRAWTSFRSLRAPVEPAAAGQTEPRVRHMR